MAHRAVSARAPRRRAGEHAAAEGDDVVGVHPVEAGGRCRTDHRRLREQRRAACVKPVARPPSRRPAGRRPIHIERPDAVEPQVRDVGDRARDRTPVVWLEVCRDGDSVRPCGAETSASRASSADPRPHHETMISSIPALRISFIWAPTTSRSPDE